MLLSNRDKDNSSEGLKCWPFMSVHQWAENPAGEWQVIIQDNVSDLSRDIPILSSFKILKLYLPPATKLGQGCIFTGVCDSVHRGECYPSMHCRWYPSLPCMGGGSALGRVSAPGGVAWWRPPGWLLLRAVLILLECILVCYNFHFPFLIIKAIRKMTA